jgi:hypothetical protein
MFETHLKVTTNRFILATCALAVFSLVMSGTDLAAKPPGGCADYKCSSNSDCTSNDCDLCAGDNRCGKIA